MPRTKADVLKYLTDTRAHYAVYHNHKEVSAWAGVVLYVIFAAQIAFASDEMFENNAVVYAAMALSVGFFLAVLVYLHTQFRLRQEAANYVAALLYLHVEYLAKVETEINEADWLVEPRPDSGHQSPQFLPKQVLNKALEMNRVGHCDRRKLECAAYTIVILAFLAGALRLWLWGCLTN